MTERERTTIRLVGLVVHALGLVAVVAALAGAPWPSIWAGLVLFVVGGCWGWGMVAMAASQDAERTRRADADRMARERAGLATPGFSARFDDDPEPPLAVPPPPGVLGGP